MPVEVKEIVDKNEGHSSVPESCQTSAKGGNSNREMLSLAIAPL